VQALFSFFPFSGRCWRDGTAFLTLSPPFLLLLNQRFPSSSPVNTTRATSSAPSPFPFLPGRRTGRRAGTPPPFPPFFSPPTPSSHTENRPQLLFSFGQRQARGWRKRLFPFSRTHRTRRTAAGRQGKFLPSLPPTPYLTRLRQSHAAFSFPPLAWGTPLKEGRAPTTPDPPLFPPTPDGLR